MKLFKHLKHRHFPQSNIIDQVISLSLLDKQGFKAVTLENPILWRGDIREPNRIDKEGGFFRQNIENWQSIPSITESGQSLNCIAASTEVIHAIGFADNPDQAAQGSLKSPTAWVYMLYAPKGIKLYEQNLPNEIGRNDAKLVREVTLSGVPAHHIIAAFEIETTTNDIEVYYQKDIASRIDPNKIQWQIPIIRYFINKNCSLETISAELYRQALEEFMSHCDRGYYFIPWSPFPEDETFGLDAIQKKALVQFNLSRLEARKICFESQIEALALGIPKTLIFSKIFSRLCLEAIKRGASYEEVIEAKGFELEAMSKGFTYVQAKGITNRFQLYGLECGFNRKEVLASWFSIKHCHATDAGIPIEDLIGKCEQQIIDLMTEYKKNQCRN